MAEKTKARKGGEPSLTVAYPAKVALPARRPAIIRRERLTDALAEGTQRRITIVSAPAGYGKTTLLLDFAQSWEQPVCWYGLDERDRDLRTFLTYFVAAGRRLFPDFGLELAALLESGDLPDAAAAADLMASAIEAQRDPFIFILDDFHFLDEAADDLRETIEGWLYRLPRNCHVVLSGRTQPQLSVVPLMSVRQELATVTAADFAFTCEEVVQLCRDVLGKEVSLDEAQHLADLTEGWAGALVLLSERVQENRTNISLEQLRGSDTLFQYINLEQFNPLPAELKDFLLGSALLRTMDADTVNELLGVGDTEDRLNHLERLNLFVLRDVKDKSRSRYHRLFRAFLISHLRTKDPERFQQLNLRAAAMKEKTEEWEEAVYHYIQAAAWDKIVAVTDRVGWRFFEEGRWDTLIDWIEAVPAEELASQPTLILWKARILHVLNQVDRALSLLAQAMTAFESKKEWVNLAGALVTKGMCLRVKGDYHESKEALTKARKLLLQYDGPVSLTTEARKELGITLSRAGELAAAAKELRSVLEVYEAQGDAYNIAHTSDRLGITLALEGRISEAIGYLEAARPRWLTLGNQHRLVETLINLGMMYYFQGDYGRSEEVMRQGLETARAIGSQRPEAYLLASLGDIKRDTGAFPDALEFYNACLELAWTLDDGFITIHTTASIANTHRLTGDLANAEAWSARASAEAEKKGGALEHGLCLVTAGLLKRDQADPRAASELLEKALPHLKEAGAGRELAAANFHLAEAYFGMKRKRLALECLEIAARHVKDLGYDHFLVLEAQRNQLLVQYGAANKIADGYYARILKLMKGAASTRDTSDDPEPDGDAPSGTAIEGYGFGNLRAEMAGREITDLEWRSEKGKEMFFFFLANRRPLRKEEIVAALWPDLPEEKTTSAFHGNMYRLRAALYKGVIAKESGRYILDPQARFTFDVEDFQKALEAADKLKGGAEAIPYLEKALALYKGQFAPDFYSEWAETLRWQFEEQFMSLLTTLAAAYNQAREFKRSSDICQRILEIDEFNEAAWYRLMSNYIQSGQLEAARYSYNRYVQVLANDDMADEAPDFDELVKEISAG